MREYAVFFDGEEDNDFADWYNTWSEAFEEAENSLNDNEHEQAVIVLFVDGEYEEEKLRMVIEDGDIHQYDQYGDRLWA